ncbi:hypothetical protein J6590_080124 [Homalodisca vitripennis]|nr:hypothetical protein J6590_080124 [Homalodisca vitripennis]
MLYCWSQILGNGQDESLLLVSSHAIVTSSLSNTDISMPRPSRGLWSEVVRLRACCSQQLPTPPHESVNRQSSINDLRRTSVVHQGWGRLTSIVAQTAQFSQVYDVAVASVSVVY